MHKNKRKEGLQHFAPAQEATANVPFTAFLRKTRRNAAI